MSIHSKPTLPQPDIDLTVMITVPYIAGMLHLSTLRAVIDHGFPVTLHPIHADDQHGYPRLMLDEWAAPWTTIIVEQDMVPPPGTFAALAHCDQVWCTSPYLISGRIETAALGCTKFAPALKQNLPEIATTASRHHDGKGSAMTWHSLDAALARALYARGLTPHVHHEYQSIHLHNYQPETTP